MQLTYDELTDTLYLYLSQAAVATTVEATSRFLVDYDASGNVRGIEIIGTSERVTLPPELPRRDDVERLMQRARNLPVLA
jgi:Uncharacterized conserved small protein